VSCDYLVWYSEQRISSQEAQHIYLRLCESDTSGVTANPAVEAFYAELTAKHPEIDTVPKQRLNDHDYCPWSCALDHSPAHVIMCCVWPKAAYVHNLVQELARKHGLTVYDPQSDEVIYPDGTRSRRDRPSRTSLWILFAFALIFAGMFAYSGILATGNVALVLYVFAALCVCMAAACFRQALA
jgi:hypothetical protein